MKFLGIFVVAVVLGLVGNVGAQSLTTLHSFTDLSDQTFPASPLIQGSDGNFYGTTSGGPGPGDTQFYGTVFRITPGGSLSNLWVFSGGDDGAFTSAPLVQGSDGFFYGTTQNGGTSGWGNIFRVSPVGALTNLVSFDPPPGPSLPYAGLVQGADGNFYGTTGYGGNTNGGVLAAYGRGTIFRMTPGGIITNLHSFNGADGWAPYAGLVQGTDGNFYGTTFVGGTSSNCPNGCGTVFRMSQTGSLTTLWSFSKTDGASPYAGVVQGADGNFYGTTTSGGAHGTGTVYRVSSSGSLTTLWSFTGGADGAAPLAGLVQGSDGNFYGTTPAIGAGHSGTVFRVSSTGGFTNLWSFTNGSDGANPQAGLVQGSDGSFYGTTSQLNSGPNKFGTVFRISVPLNPPANQINALQTVGSDIIFTIPAVAGETYQLQMRTDLQSGTWSNVPGLSVSNSIGALLTLTNFGGAVVAPQAFYRFDITP